jgi:NAD(P)-dependent dehydrogenase (short-subunit alcohol dehydrogenase family)
LAHGGAQGAFNYAQSAVATETLKAGVETPGIRIIGVQGGAADTEAAYGMIKQVEEAFGCFDLSVHNTIITRDKFTLCMKEEDWDAVSDTNLKRTWNFLSDFACVK